MQRVRKFGIWARSELGIGHDVQRAFRTGGIRTWGRSRAVKSNRLVIVIIIRAHHSTTYIDAAYSYRPSSVVCRSVCLSH